MNVEQAILGTMIKENYLIKDTVLKPHHFEDNRHKQLLHTMKKLSNDGKEVDKITLSTLSNLKALGGISYINECVSYANVGKFENYESIVIESWKNREKRNVLNNALSGDWEIGKVVEKLDSINEAKTDDHTSINDALSKLADAPWTKQERKRGVTTGFKQMDDMTNGFQNAELTIIAARPSMGKTDVMVHFAKQAGWTGYLPIVFSLEMPEERITERLIASTGQYNRSKMRDPYSYLTDGQKDKWSLTLGKVGQTNIQVFDKAGQTVSEMRSKVRKMIHEHDKQPIIFIDYLTLIRPENKYNNGHMQVTEISNNLKGMAKEFNCPVICLSQLSRSVEQRQDKHPLMSDIRESGSVEQDADLIIFLYRDKYYNKESDDTLELMIAKQRNGPVGTVKTRYNEHTGEINEN